MLPNSYPARFMPAAAAAAAGEQELVTRGAGRSPAAAAMSGSGGFNPSALRPEGTESGRRVLAVAMARGVGGRGSLRNFLHSISNWYRSRGRITRSMPAARPIFFLDWIQGNV